MLALRVHKVLYLFFSVFSEEFSNILVLLPGSRNSQVISILLFKSSLNIRIIEQVRAVNIGLQKSFKGDTIKFSVFAFKVINKTGKIWKIKNQVQLNQHYRQKELNRLANLALCSKLHPAPGRQNRISRLPPACPEFLYYTSHPRRWFQALL